MSERFFDNLARTLATPMPRRRALRLAGAALVAAAAPGFRPPSARAGTLALGTFSADRPCSGFGGKFCGFAVNNGFNIGCCADPAVPFVCCNQNQKTGSWCCREGYTCGPGDGKGGKPNCICAGDDCGGKCCPKNQECENGNCVSCTSERKCGKSCCKKGEFCAASSQSLCCQKSDDICAVLPKPGSGGKAGKRRCCPNGTTCCANDKRTDCCGPQQKCRSGQCVCPKGKLCGTECCPKDKPICSEGKCCPKGEVNCNGKCCRNGDCCGNVCCTKGEFCASSFSAPLPRLCCASDRIVVLPSGKPVCCPKGTAPNEGETACCPKGDPNCCQDSEGTDLHCLGDSICVGGVCKKVVVGNV